MADRKRAVLLALRYPAQGADVVRIQLFLRSAGFELAPDGIFGSMTREAVKTWQAMHGLPSDGVVDGATWDTMAL